MIDISQGRTLFGQSCHLDHQQGRSKYFTTFEAAAYDPDLKSMSTYSPYTWKVKQSPTSVGFVWVQNKIKSELTSIGGEPYL